MAPATAGPRRHCCARPWPTVSCSASAALPRAAKLSWTSLKCEVRGTLDRVEGKTRFTEIVVEAVLEVPAGTDREKAAKAMERAEHACLISNSLVAERRLVATVSLA